MKRYLVLLLTVVLTVTFVLPGWNVVIADSGDPMTELPVVGSYENLRQILVMTPTPTPYITPSPTPTPTAPGVTPTPAATGTPTPVGTPTPTPVVNPTPTPSHSGTNNQVDGVEEADFVMTDGTYIYQISRKILFIAKAYPADNMSVISQIDFNGQIYTPMELQLENNKLIVICSASINVSSYTRQMSVALIYDITDRANISLIREVQLEGNYVSCRMIGSMMYLVASKPIYYYDLNYNTANLLPVYKDTAIGSDYGVIGFDKIRYFPEFVKANYLLIEGFDLEAPTAGVNVSAYLASSTGMYVSMDNMYIAETEYIWGATPVPTPTPSITPTPTPTYAPPITPTPSPTPTPPTPTPTPTLPVTPTPTPTPGLTITPTPTPPGTPPPPPVQKTLVYKFGLNAGNIQFKARTEVPGRILNQFSMDEYNGYFRIATTTGSGTSMANNLYVYDSLLNKVGTLENLAPGESIRSVLFMGEKAIIVTFRQVDPLFVIDVSVPANPQILGILKITGFSEYLHPYDDNHIIGIGKDADEFGRVKGVKLALFDITDVTNPVQMFVEYIGTTWTNSQISYTHKAFMFDKDKGLLAFPITVYEGTDNTWSTMYFQGAYVYNLDLVNGFRLKGKISHLPDGFYPMDYNNYYKNTTENYVERTMYIEDVLYTLSLNKIMAHSLSELNKIGELSLLGLEPEMYTPTPSPTPTPSITPTPTPTSPANIKVQFCNNNLATTINTIYTDFKVVNTGTTPVNLADVKLRYYFTNDGTQNLNFACDWSPIGNANVTSAFTTIAATNADRYCEVGFTSGAGSLAAGAAIEVKGRIWKSDWSNFTQTNDYSFNSSASNYVDWTKVTAYTAGALSWGVEP